MADRSRHSRYRFGEAARAMKKLLADPEDTAQVFTIVDALSGRSGERLVGAIRRDPTGRRLLAERPEILSRLQNSVALGELPEGSLGRAYLAFVEREGITAKGLVDASLDGRRYGSDELTAELDWTRDWMRDTHDLWHVVTGYQGDLVGEAALLAFGLAQTKNPGVAFIVSVAWLKAGEPAVRRAIVEGFRRGRRARFLPAQDWRELLALPLSEVRRRLRVGPVPDYPVVRSHEAAAAA